MCNGSTSNHSISRPPVKPWICYYKVTGPKCWCRKIKFTTVDVSWMAKIKGAYLGCDSAMLVNWCGAGEWESDHTNILFMEPNSGVFICMLCKQGACRLWWRYCSGLVGTFELSNLSRLWAVVQLWAHDLALARALNLTSNSGWFNVPVFVPIDVIMVMVSAALTVWVLITHLNWHWHSYHHLLQPGCQHQSLHLGGQDTQSQSGLLAHTDNQGKLNLPEFHDAMGLIYCSELLIQSEALIHYWLHVKDSMGQISLKKSLQSSYHCHQETWIHLLTSCKIPSRMTTMHVCLLHLTYLSHNSRYITASYADTTRQTTRCNSIQTWRHKATWWVLPAPQPSRQLQHCSISCNSSMPKSCLRTHSRFTHRSVNQISSIRKAKICITVSFTFKMSSKMSCADHRH